MKRLLTSVGLIVGTAIVGALIWMFGDYYDVLFGRSHHSAWNVVQNDTTGRMESRAIWGLVTGGCLGLILVVAGMMKRRPGNKGRGPVDDE